MLWHKFRGSTGVTILAALLLVTQAWTASRLAMRYSVTLTEAAHIPAGLAAWHQADLSLYSVNPPLTKLVATSPLLLFDDLRLAALLAPRDPTARSEFTVAYLFSETNSFKYHELIVAARIAGILWLIGGGIVLWRFAAELYGRIAGIGALTLWVTDPFLTAHGSLMTPDVPAMVLAIATIYEVWKFGRGNCMWRVGPAISISIMLGLSILAKFTNLLLIPAVVAIAAISYVGATETILLRCARLTKFLSIIALGSALTIWCGYFCDGFGTRLGEIEYQSRLFNEVFGSRQADPDSWISSIPSPLPPEMLRGMDVQQVDFEGRKESYMRGITRSTGWPYYYAYALFVKLPIGLLVLCVMGLLVVVCETRKRPWIDSASILIPLVLFFGIVSLKYSYTNHARYVMPCLPLLMLCASRLTQPVFGLSVRATRIGFTVMVSLSVLSAACNYPNWLGYFNEMAGGPSRGWWHLEDSNVDWGQDLILLRDWIDGNPWARPISVRTHHTINIGVYLDDRIHQQGRPSYVAVDAFSLVHNDTFLMEYELVDRVGTSFFIFDLRKPKEQ